MGGKEEAEEVIQRLNEPVDPKLVVLLLLLALVVLALAFCG